jgi:hypothetical protein
MIMPNLGPRVPELVRKMLYQIEITDYRSEESG